LTQPSATSLPTADIAAIRKVNEDYLRCMLSQDYGGIAKLYAEDAVLMPPNHPVAVGPDAIRKWNEGFPRVIHFRFEYHNIDGRDDLAYVRGAYFITIQPEGAPGPIEDTGKFLEILKKQQGGSWLFAFDTFNSDR